MLVRLLFLFIFSSSAEARNYVTPTRQLSVAEFPKFGDDYDFNDMEMAIKHQLTRFKDKSLKGTIRLGKKHYPLSLAEAGLKKFQSLMFEFKSCAELKTKDACYERFNQELKHKFNVFVPNNRSPAFFTGYHTHPLEGRFKPEGEFIYPVYALPKGADRRHLRSEIDFEGKLAGKGLEIIYAKSLFDLYLLHVEGGGYVTVKGGERDTSFYLSYAGTNKRKWNWLSRYMLAKKYISNDSIAAQRKFLEENPKLAQEIFSSCPSYVYFKISETPPVGSDQVPLTDGRSLATDRKLYPFKGLLTFVETERPEESGNYNFKEEDSAKIKHVPFQRFFLDQDTGGAIKGKARADLYFGRTPYAFYAASYQAKMGQIYFLMLKN
jgi:membrane-bound lytic murein transglycosylase A